jgi:hypothetical protein
MLAPRVFLGPVYVKTTTAGRYKRALGPSGKPISDVPANANRIIFVYALVVVPLTLVASVPIVLEPFAVVVSGHYGGAYYVSPPGPAEILGFAMSLWGLSCLSMVNHYLPDGGGEKWKKLSALTFLMGVGVALSAPTVPDWIGGARAKAAGNPYATISSVGTHLATNDRSRSGGWGLLSASLGTLLAVTGPLELQERRDASGRKDTLVLFRLMVFSLMFGCGVAWFVTMQSMSEEEFLTVIVTATACMAMAFFGTVSAVLGYFLELQNFDEASQVAKVWIGAFPIFGLIAGVSQFATESSHPFGMGGWLSTYLALCGGVTSAKLAGSGFWTADGMFGPLLHVAGLIATLPSLYFLVTQLWTGERTSKAAISAPLNLVPLALCKGIAALRALSLFGLIGGLLQIVTPQQHDKQSRMQI